MPDLTTDATIAHYRLLELLGEGGLGEVFRARDTKVGRTVALKLLPGGFLEKPTRRERFVADASAAAALSHPNIATLFDVGEDEGRWYLAYEFTPGQNLRQHMAGRAMHPRQALEIGIQIADALAEAHSHDVLHADLRPENIVITGKGSSKLLDLGIVGRDLLIDNGPGALATVGVAVREVILRIAKAYSVPKILQTINVVYLAMLKSVRRRRG
jgi:serine/threonine protein kinase